jgi:hypothetical protein
MVKKISFKNKFILLFILILNLFFVGCSVSDGNFKITINGSFPENNSSKTINLNYSVNIENSNGSNSVLENSSNVSEKNEINNTMGGESVNSSINLITFDEGLILVESNFSKNVSFVENISESNFEEVNDSLNYSDYENISINDTGNIEMFYESINLTDSINNSNSDLLNSSNITSGFENTSEIEINLGNNSVLLSNESSNISLDNLTFNWYRPKPLITWHWQLTGNLKMDYDVDLYDVDLFETSKETIEQLHKKGIKVICYVNVGAYEPYRPDSNEFPNEVLGKKMSGWEDEKWLDISNFKKFEHIILARFDLAKEKGCDGIEPDNIDGYSNKNGFNLTYEDQLRYNLWLAEKAHERNLSIALKNDLEQINDLEPFFDFAINEECFYYNECDLLMPFINNGKAVLHVEYELGKKKFCGEAKALNFSSMKLNYDLNGKRNPC